MKRLDLTGKTFSRLTVVSYAGRAKNGNALWNCECSCGGTAVVDGYRLRNGATKSCGCYRRELMRKLILENPKTRAQMGNTERFTDSEGVNVGAITKRRSTNRSGVVGVSFDRQSGKWNSRLFMKGKLLLNKQFVDFQAAVDARKEAEKKYLTPLLERIDKSNDSKSSSETA